MTFDLTLKFYSECEIQKDTLKIEFNFHIETDGPLACLNSIMHFNC